MEMFNKIKIKIGDETDIKTIESNTKIMANETEHKTLKQSVIHNGINEVLNNPSLGWYYLAEIDGNNAGQLMITREWSDCNNGYFWWIQSVFVKKEYRKNGVYSILHNHAKEKAEKMCAIGLRLYVDTRNKSAQSVYKKLGMVNSNYVFFEDNWSKC